MLQLHIDSDYSAYGPELRYAKGSWDWRIYTMQYQYSKDPTRFNIPLVIKLLGSRFTNLASNINDRLTGADCNYQFSHVRPGFSYQHAVSAVDQTTTDVYTAIVNFDLPHNLSLELEAGTAIIENSNDTNFALVALGYDF